VKFTPPERDIKEIISFSDLFQQFENSNVLVTGASGFVGTWLGSSLVAANKKYKLNMQIFLLSRTASSGHAAKESKNPHFLYHDLRNPLPPNLPQFDYVFHTATPSQPATGGNIPASVYEITSKGTNNLLMCMGKQSEPPVFLNTSSGAVDKLNPDNPESDLQIAYRNGKEEAEYLVETFSNQGKVIGTNPRLYTFAGPGIDTTAHFVAGEFMRLALSNEPLTIKGNPKTLRSYMYPVDLMKWLITISNNPTLEVIRVGNPNPITVAELASLVSLVVNLEHKSFAGDENLALNHYVPDLSETLRKYDLKISVPIEDAFHRWKNYLLNVSNQGGVES
jgi:nucleoside-diphosphate-sugar epimerase